MKKILVLLILLPFLAVAQIPDYKPNTYVNDFTNALTDLQIKTLNDSLFAIEKRTSVQIAVILINKLPDNIEIEDYARNIGRKWHVGNARNGLVYVAALEQRKQRLEVANHLETDIPDAVALGLTDGLKPYFREKNYFVGLQALIAGINQRIDPVAKEQLRLADAELEKKHEKQNSILLIILYWVLGLGAITFFVVRFYIRPRILRKIEKEKVYAQKLKMLQPRHTSIATNKFKEEPKPKKVISKDDVYIPPTYTPPTNNSSSYTPSNDDNSSSYGNWGSGSSDSSSSSDSGFSGGGSSNDW